MCSGRSAGQMANGRLQDVQERLPVAAAAAQPVPPRPVRRRRRRGRGRGGRQEGRLEGRVRPSSRTVRCGPVQSPVRHLTFPRPPPNPAPLCLQRARQAGRDAPRFDSQEGRRGRGHAVLPQPSRGSGGDCGVHHRVSLHPQDPPPQEGKIISFFLFICIHINVRCKGVAETLVLHLHDTQTHKHKRAQICSAFKVYVENMSHPPLCLFSSRLPGCI